MRLDVGLYGIERSCALVLMQSDARHEVDFSIE